MPENQINNNLPENSSIRGNKIRAWLTLAGVVSFTIGAFALVTEPVYKTVFDHALFNPFQREVVDYLKFGVAGLALIVPSLMQYIGDKLD